MVVPFSAGGPTDVLGRILGQRASQSLGQQIIVENRLGAGGNMRVAEGVFRILRHAGFRDQSVPRAFFTLMAYTFGFAALEPARGGGETAEERAEAQRQRWLGFESLPLREFPLVVELAVYAAAGASDEQFEYGLDRLIEGIQGELEGASSG